MSSSVSSPADISPLPPVIQDNGYIALITLWCCIIAFPFECYYFLILDVPISAIFFLLLFSLLNVGGLLIRHRHPLIFSILTSFTLLTTWQLCSLAGMNLAAYIYLAALFLVVINYVIAVIVSFSSTQHPMRQIELRYEWPLFFMRLMLGLELIPYFCEKLFAGPGARHIVAQIFLQLGVEHSTVLVLTSGVVEFACSLMVSCGIFTRSASILLLMYLLSTHLFSPEVSYSYLWDSPGGSWGFPIVWVSVTMLFAIFGASRYSMDTLLKAKLKLPNYVLFLMGGK